MSINATKKHIQKLKDQYIESCVFFMQYILKLHLSQLRSPEKNNRYLDYIRDRELTFYINLDY